MPTCSTAWYKLTTRDMGPHARCLGPDVPPPQPFQRPLPAARRPLPDFKAVGADITALLSQRPDAAGSLSTLAYQCASTYRDTDRSGGCNGARIRYAPEKDWPANKGLAPVLALLGPIKAKYPNLSWADLIVLAGVLGVGNWAYIRRAPYDSRLHIWEQLVLLSNVYSSSSCSQGDMGGAIQLAGDVLQHVASTITC
jgi:catalase (peroxidase I)